MRRTRRSGPGAVKGFRAALVKGQRLGYATRRRLALMPEEPSMCADWTKSAWRSHPRVQMPDYPDAAALGAAEARLASYPPLVFAGEARKLQAQLALASQGQGLPAAGRRLRRELRRALRRQHPRHLQGDAADGRGADLRRQVPGGEGRPHRRPVRQAALGADRDPGRDRAPLLPRRHRQRLRLHPRGAGARSRADAAGLHPVRRHAEPPARLQPGRLCRHQPRAFLDPRLHRRGRGLRAVPQARQPHLRRPRVHGRRRGRARRPPTRCTGSTSTPRTRRCCSSTRRRSAASTRRPGCRWRARGT